ncbi:TIGR00730 family Rossman fold protein [Christiangramia sabulilitoris]|uniref:Cytokinin riboside 5'-monophosphate phosphoribohydrolase n=1 Tax=Christiangramia sabulilitoris TaxID=2583991 RepID=A0A550I7R1_9FLAO|nr:TIGR00730 family Rossman fold protein [Christiangramia sabulilitoris]TRO67013.1 TIGR00730 family Rossman fold protein [Christiangramia sabulilitoris]
MSEELNNIHNLAVFCASSDGNDKNIYDSAYNVGRTMAKYGIRLVYGGSKLGLMGQVAKGIMDHEGKATGVIPDFLKTKEVVHTHLDKLITTNDMHERKMTMNELSDAFLTLPGGFGTFEELFEIVTWAQLGLHRKPIGLLNINGFYDDLINMLQKMCDKGLLKPENLDILLISDNFEDLLEQMRKFEPQPVPKWMNKNQT